MNEFRTIKSDFYTEVEHEQQDPFFCLENLVLASDDGRNLDKVVPVLSLLTFMFYNKVVLVSCIKLGLFSQLIRMLINLKSLEHTIIGNSKKIPINKKAKLKAIYTVIHSFNACFDLMQ